MTKEEVVQQIVADYSARLGIPAPNIEFERRKGQRRYYLGVCYREENSIYIKIRGRTLRHLRKTVAHELIHKAFEKKSCGNGRSGEPFRKYVKALTRGHMVFNGRGLVFD